jgi:hypothetical protein
MNPSPIKSNDNQSVNPLALEGLGYSSASTLRLSNPSRENSTSSLSGALNSNISTDNLNLSNQAKTVINTQTKVENENTLSILENISEAQATTDNVVSFITLFGQQALSTQQTPTQVSLAELVYSA